MPFRQPIPQIIRHQRALLPVGSHKFFHLRSLYAAKIIYILYISKSDRLLDGACNYFEPRYPRGITLGNDTISINDPSYYSTDAFTENAIKFIEESKTENPDKPFFLYLAYNAPHWPLQAPKEDVDRYRGKYLNGWEAVRNDRYERMINLGIISPEWLLSPQDSLDWNSLSEEKKQEMELRRAIYAAQVDRMDQNIGRLISFLEKDNLINNTVVIFIDDNGGCAEGGELGGGPARQLETSEGYFLTYGQAWANASNTPFRWYKHWVHEGGISSPCIVRWPAGIPCDINGTFVQQYGFLPDMMATFADLACAKYPATYKGNEIYPFQGKSLIPLLKGENKPVHQEPIFWEHEGNKAVRMGKYKLVLAWNDNKPAKWELYDMEKDRTEMHDLSDQMPGKVVEMEKIWEDWAKRSMVEPWPRIRKLEHEKIVLKSN